MGRRFFVFPESFRLPVQDDFRKFIIHGGGEAEISHLGKQDQDENERDRSEYDHEGLHSVFVLFTHSVSSQRTYEVVYPPS